MTKKCCKCKQLLSEDLFTKNKTTKDGLNKSCKNCHNQYTRKHYINNKTYYKSKSIVYKKEYKREYDEWYKNIKASLKCERCPENHIACLEFHHIDPSKKNDTISNMINNWESKDSVLLEMSKCIVLCANYHRKEHYKKNMPATQNGTVLDYESSESNLNVGSTPTVGTSEYK